MGMLKFRAPVLPLPADEYDRDIQVQFIRALDIYFAHWDSKAAIEVESVILDSIIRTPADSITAGTTQTQAGATALTADINRVTVSAVNGDGVKLPTAVPGGVVMVINGDSAQTIQIWPNTDDDIDGGAVDAVDANTLAAGATRTYSAIDNISWYTQN